MFPAIDDVPRASIRGLDADMLKLSVLDLTHNCKALNILQLFSFIRADLASFRPSNSFSNTSDAASPSDTTPDQHLPSHPKSLLLLTPLFTSYSLPPVSTRAQASVPLPVGLDLDTPLFIFPSKAADDNESSEEDDFDEETAVVDRGVIRLGNGKNRAGGEGPGERVMTGEERELMRVVAAAAATGGHGKKKKKNGKSAKGMAKAKGDETPEERLAVSDFDLFF